MRRVLDLVTKFFHTGINSRQVESSCFHTSQTPYAVQACLLTGAYSRFKVGGRMMVSAKNQAPKAPKGWV